jgi:hypothetical protein
MTETVETRLGGGRRYLREDFDKWILDLDVSFAPRARRLALQLGNDKNNNIYSSASAISRVSSWRTL